MKKIMVAFLTLMCIPSNHRILCIDNSEIQITPSAPSLLEQEEKEPQSMPLTKALFYCWIKSGVTGFSLGLIENSSFVSNKLKWLLFISAAGSTCFDLINYFSEEEDFFQFNLKKLTQNKLYTLARCITDIPCALFFGLENIYFFYSPYTSLGLKTMYSSLGYIWLNSLYYNSKQAIEDISIRSDKSLNE